MGKIHDPELEQCKTYSSVLNWFENKIGRQVSNDFSCKNFEEKILLVDMFHKWESIFRRLCNRADCLSLVLNSPSDYLIKRSILYSSNIASPLPGKVVDDWYGIDIPNAHINFLRQYHSLIRKDVASPIMSEFEQIDSTELREEMHKFNAEELECAIVSENDNDFIKPLKEDSIHFKIMLPDVSGIDLADLISIMRDEEIFHNYYNALNLLNLKRQQDSPEQKLHEIVLEVDEKTRELNAKFKQLAKKRTWQAVRSFGGLSLTGFSYLLPMEIGATMRTIFGTLSAVSIGDGILGIVQEKSELETNPYFFSYAVGSLTSHKESRPSE